MLESKEITSLLNKEEIKYLKEAIGIEVCKIVECRHRIRIFQGSIKGIRSKK